MNQEEAVSRRRRGAVLEAAVLEAAWAELAEHGYGGFTVDATATRAGTSKAVLYRRWQSKPELAQAAITHVLAADPVAVPDTGALRDDVLALLRWVNDRRVAIAAHVIVNLGEFYRETGTNLASIRDSVTAGQTSVMSVIVARAVERGEITGTGLSERVVRLPIDLLRLELLMTSAPMADEGIVEIVDDLFLPLVV
jgi:AcrR family transcriptional regulator